MRCGGVAEYLTVGSCPNCTRAMLDIRIATLWPKGRVVLVGRGCTEAVPSCASTPKVKCVRLLITSRDYTSGFNHDIRIAWLGFHVYPSYSRRDEDADSSSSLTTHPGAACIAGGHREHGRLRFPPTEPTYDAATVLCLYQELSVNC